MSDVGHKKLNETEFLKDLHKLISSLQKDIIFDVSAQKIMRLDGESYVELKKEEKIDEDSGDGDGSEDGTGHG